MTSIHHHIELAADMSTTLKRLLVVLGMHRSGTSTITRGLNVLGVELGDNLLPPVQGDNAKGYFEDIDINALNIEMLEVIGSDWHCLAPIENSDIEKLNQKGYFLRAVDLLRQKTANASIYGIKDPRIAKLLPFWQPVFVHCEFDISYILAIRNPLSVVQSLTKRANFRPEKSYMLWLGHVLNSLIYTKEQQCILVDFDDFIESSQKVFELIAERFALKINPQALQEFQSEFIDIELRHTIYSVNDLKSDQACPPLVQEIYAVLAKLSRDKEQKNNNSLRPSIKLWEQEFNRLKSNLRLVDNLDTQIFSLNQSAVKGHNSLTTIIKTALKQNPKTFLKSFNAEWYLNNNPDVEAVGADPYRHYIEHGVWEDRLPAANLITFVGQNLLDESNEINDQLIEAKQLINVQLNNLGEIEKEHAQQLHEIHQANEQQRTEQSIAHAEREQAYVEQLSQARQKLESQLSQLNFMRSTYMWQLRTLLNKVLPIHKKLVARNPALNLVDKSNLDQFNMLDAHITASQPDASYTSINNIRISDMPLKIAANTLDELLAQHDIAFVNLAYRTILGRAPDTEGLSYYLKRLRNGISKLEIITQLRKSAEGKNHDTSLTGLDKAIKLHQYLKTPLLGAMLRFFGFNPVERDIQQNLRAIENKLYILDNKLEYRLSDLSLAIGQIKQVNNNNECTLSKESESSHIQFDADWYLEQNPDVVDSGMNPLEHYLQFGKKEWRNPMFDENWYVSQYPDVTMSRFTPREHYKKYGKSEGRCPAFNAEWYLNQYPDVMEANIDSLDHYLNYGKLEGRYPAHSSTNAGSNDYSKWIVQFDTLSNEDHAAILASNSKFNYKPLISVVMPVYNPNPVWLIEAIESIRNQIYSNWELCIADDLSSNKAIRPILESYAKKDSRIKVVFRSENGHISNASNSALEVATGDWVALLDHDDILPVQALFWVVDAINKHPNVRMIYSDEDKITEQGVRFAPYFKCDWNQDLFYSHNMFSHLGVYETKLLREIGGFRVGMEGSQDYDLALRCMERISVSQIHHIPRVLYHWRMHAESTAASTDAKPYAMIAGERAINEHFVRTGIKAKANIVPHGYRVRYALPDTLPLVSLIIPTRNGLKLLQQCVESIVNKTLYPNFEILIVDNGSDESETINYLKEVISDPRIQVITDDRPFNYSALNNAAVKLANGEIVGLINNDIEVISPDWLCEMVSHALRPEIGAVGASLWYGDDTLQHGGVILGLGGVACHAHKKLPKNNPGYMGRAICIQSFSAVTAACLIVRKSIYNSVGGLNEVDLQVAFNDVDFCIRIREAGYRNIWTPYAELYHHESATRGADDTPVKKARFEKEIAYMQATWRNELKHDPAYSPNLTIGHEDFSLAWPPRVEFLAR